MATGVSRLVTRLISDSGSGLRSRRIRVGLQPLPFSWTILSFQTRESFWSFRSYSSARPIVRAGMEGINGARRQKMSRFKNARGVRRSFE
ncbi:hypothetical protein C4D60_Mb09t15920 [Musa balbisiana]|uniref:Uncharacterized protein n=1 Tax=Musa balbisiana TaxID=52838 RepID=A0A4S8IGT7_MUSBA|nr:hypothetical protein C4D60_Mb09t15920 [Musa balbisiana]